MFKHIYSKYKQMNTHSLCNELLYNKHISLRINKLITLKVSITLVNINNTIAQSYQLKVHNGPTYCASQASGCRTNTRVRSHGSTVPISGVKVKLGYSCQVRGQSEDTVTRSSSSLQPQHERVSNIRVCFRCTTERLHYWPDYWGSAHPAVTIHRANTTLYCQIHATFSQY
jgi:hypothetical protein